MAATLDSVRDQIRVIDGIADRLNARIHPPTGPGPWTVEKPLTVGVKTMKMGFNVQGTIPNSWDNALTNNTVPAHMIGNFMRLTAWHGVPHPGYVAGMPANGIEPLLILSPPSDDIATLATKTVTAGKKIGARYYNVSNEPNFGSGPHFTAQAYAAICKTAYAALKAGDPNAIVTAPVTTGNFNGMQWVLDFLAAVDGKFDVFDSHPYYWHLPEISLQKDIMPLMAAVRPKMAIPRFGLSEIGYTTTVNPAPPGDIAQDVIATPTELMDLYPRMIFLHRGCGAEYVCYYMLREHGVDPGNYENCYGVMTSSYVDKAFTANLREALAIALPATAAANYHRGSMWATRLDSGTGQRLAVWNADGVSIDKVWVSAPSGGTLSMKTIGGGMASRTLVVGDQQVSISIGKRPLVLNGINVRFPEFS